METLILNTEDNQTQFEFSKPFLDRTLKSLGLDKVFVRASGNYLTYKNDQGENIKVLDLMGGYGSLFLGHNPEELTEHAIDLLRNDLPIHSQMSIKNSVGKLAFRISEKIGKSTGKEYISTFVNSGSEAVEAAIKHARLNFYVKKEVFMQKLAQQLHTINNFFVKADTKFNCVINGYEFKEFDELKNYYLNNANKVFASAIPVILAAEKAFHGKTTGALELTYNENYRKKFNAQFKEKSAVQFFKIDQKSVTEQLNNLILELNFPVINASGIITNSTEKIITCAGIIIEPIQGEGGVLPVPHEFLSYLRDITIEEKIPLIFDEIQCGFFRTGEFLYSNSIGVEADYYLLGKALGGGMVKNAALVIEKGQYIEEFGLLHTSTFADDEFSASISLKALEVSEKYSTIVPNIHRYFMEKLLILKKMFPEVIKEVRGVGLMLGIEFFAMNFNSSYCFQMFSRTGYLNYIFCSYLLNKWDIRVAPTLSNPHTLRLQPSVLTTMDEVDAFVFAIESLCEIIQCCDFYKLIEHLLPIEEQNLRSLKDFGRKSVPMATENEIDNVGFITHFIDENGARAGDESIALLSDDTINQLLQSVMELAVPIITGAQTIQSVDGKKVNTYFAGLLFTANMARKMLIEQTSKPYEVLCDKAIDMLNTEFSCKLIGLGQYTSVITKNGKTITNPHVAITTGNSFTVGIGVQAVMSEIDNEVFQKDGITLGVLGAGGNISSTYIKCFLPYCSSILFKGSDSVQGKIKTQRFMRELIAYVMKLAIDNGEGLHQNLYNTIISTNLYQEILKGNLQINDYTLVEKLVEELGENMPFKMLDDLFDLQQCEVTVVATNSPKAFLYPEHFATNSVVYDISVPLNCSQELIDNDKNIKVILGGVVQLPQNEKLPMKGYPLGKGEAFACISETVLLGLERRYDNFSFGHLRPNQINDINKIGEQNGFKFKKPKVEQIF